jgi:ABC-type multidrug transport system fused ATPase/permease subunit
VKNKPKQKQFSIASLFLKLFYYCTYPLLFVFGARASQGSVYNNISMLLTGIKDVSDANQIKWESLQPRSKTLIVLYSVAVIALQIFLIWAFVKFSFVEALFWKSLFDKKADTFYWAAVGMIIFKLADLLGMALKKYFQSRIIIQWRENFADQLKQQIISLFQSPALKKDGKFYSSDDFKQWSKSWGQMAEQNVEKMIRTAVNIIFNSLNALMLTVYFGHILVMMSWQMVFWALGIALGLKIILDLVNYFANDDVYSRYQTAQLELRATGMQFVGSATMMFGLGLGNASKKEFEKANQEVSKTARSYAGFRIMVDAIRWGLREIVEPLVHVLTAVFYFTGQLTFARLNLLANAAMKLINTLLDLGTDVDRYNTFDMAFKSVKEQTMGLPEPATLTPVKLESETFINSVKNNQKVTFNKSPDPKEKELVRIQGGNGAGKSCYYLHVMDQFNAHRLSNLSSETDYEKLFDSKCDERLLERYSTELGIKDLSKKIGHSSGGKAWKHLISHYWAIRTEKVTQPEIIIFDELDAAIDAESKETFAAACSKVVEQLNIRGFITSHSESENIGGKTVTCS